MPYDVIIVGGGPAGLSAALALGRARKSVLLCDAGARRNAAAEHIHTFVTRDGTPPNEFREIGRQQLAPYRSVEVRDVRVESITGARGAFDVTLATGSVKARRILLCTGMVDEMLPLDGFRELWGRSIFQCPYCHGWEVQDRRWGYLARSLEALHFPMVLRGWTREVTVFTSGAFDVPADVRDRFGAAGIRIETREVARLVARENRLSSVQLSDGADVPCEVLFAHPPQRHVELVRTLGPSLDEGGFVRVHAMTCETSIPGIYAAGDLMTRMQGAILAAAYGVQAASVINHELTAELAVL
jgi:thioredoxin reductase